MAIEVKANAATAKKALKKLADAVENINPELEEIGDRLADETQARFLRQQSPTGRPWKRSKLAKKQNRKTLIKSKWLLESIRAIVSDGELQVGTDVWYGRLHQQGYKASQKRQKRKKKTTIRIPGIPSDGARIRLGTLTPNPAQRIRSVVPSRKRVQFKKARRAQPRTTKVPARKYLGISANDRKAMREIIRARAERAWV